jgi:hypothetical protein
MDTGRRAARGANKRDPDAGLAQAFSTTSSSHVNAQRRHSMISAVAHMLL